MSHISDDRLDIYLNSHLLGFLYNLQHAKLAFRYADKWLDHQKAYPISISLPLSHQVFEDNECHAFFANLLPEATVRETICRSLGISASNDFKLLTAIGGECAGAISLVAPNENRSNKLQYRHISAQQMFEILQRLPQQPLLTGETDVRLSLAGAQNKLPIYVHQHDFYIPLNTSPSTHIIKPPIKQFSETTINEYFCMQLAKTSGLNVPEVELWHHQGKLFYLIKRYDRIIDSKGNIQRIHQEDFCQALNMMPQLKYEADGGPSIYDCVRILREYSIKPAYDIEQLLRWIIFNYLIGNCDAHAKNLSLILTVDGCYLAPFYDLLSTVIYPGISTKLAFKIGGENRLRWLQQRHWKRFAERIDVNPKLIRLLQEETIESIRKHSGEIQQQMHSPEIVVKIMEHINR